MSKSHAIEVATTPSLEGGNDAAAAKQLGKLFSDAQNGMRRIVALGLFAWELKELKLKHGQFGPWLAAHCPKLTTIDSATEKPKPSRALQGYMELTKNVLHTIGLGTVEKYLETVGKCANDAHLGGGKFLLIADKKVPEAIRPVREKIFALVDGKTQQQLKLDFEQIEEPAAKVKGGGKSKPAKPISAEDKIKAEDEQTLALYDAAYQAILALKDIDDAQHHRVPPKNRQVLLEAAVKLNDKLRSLGKK